MRKLIAILAIITSLTILTSCGNHRRSFQAVDVADVTTLTVGTPFTDFIVGANDANKYVVELDANITYQIRTFNLSSDMDTVLRLFDIDGALLAESDNISEADLASLIEYLITEGGFYCIIVTHKDPDASNGMYDIIVEVITTPPPVPPLPDPDDDGDDDDDDGDDDDGDDDGDGDGDDDDDDGDEDDDDGDDDDDDDDCPPPGLSPDGPPRGTPDCTPGNGPSD